MQPSWHGRHSCGSLSVADESNKVARLPAHPSETGVVCCMWVLPQRTGLLSKRAAVQLISAACVICAQQCRNLLCAPVRVCQVRHPRHAADSQSRQRRGPVYGTSAPSARARFQLRTRPVRAALVWRCMACSLAFWEGVALADALGSIPLPANLLPGELPVQMTPSSAAAEQQHAGSSHHAACATCLQVRLPLCTCRASSQARTGCLPGEGSCRCTMAGSCRLGLLGASAELAPSIRGVLASDGADRAPPACVPSSGCAPACAAAILSARASMRAIHCCSCPCVAGSAGFPAAACAPGTCTTQGRP